MVLRAVYGGGSDGGGGPDLTQSNPSDVLYIHGDANHTDAWRVRAGGVHPAHDQMTIEHRAELTEADIALDDTKVAAIEADTTFNENNIYHATVLTDTRADLNIPLGLDGDMTTRMIMWNGAVWISCADRWVVKGNFNNSIFSDRGIFRRMNIIDTDPNDPLAYPQTPAQGVTLGARFTAIAGEAFVGAHLSLRTADGIFGMFPFMSHGGPAAVSASVDHIVAFTTEGLAVAIEYSANHTAKTYAVGDIVVVSGLRYRAIVAGPQTSDFPAEIAKWELAPQDPTDFLALTDTPDLAGTYVGNAGLSFQVNPGETGIEYGQALGLQDTVQFGNVVTVNDIVVGRDLAVTRNLLVNGTTTTINSETLTVTDKNIEMGVVATPTDFTADGGGITLQGGVDGDKTILWTSLTQSWDFNQKVIAQVGLRVIGDYTNFGLNGDPDSLAAGANALGSTTTGSSNTAFGTDAGAAITGGFMNTGFGQGALKSVTDGFFNTAVGMLALSIATAQFDNTAVGMAALKFALGDGNSVLGARAMGGGLGTGSDNAVIGVDAFKAATDGSRNVSIGALSMALATFAKSNIAIGWSALGGAISGDFNVAIGEQALILSTSDFNVAIGNEVGSKIVTAVDLVGIGVDAYRLGIASGNTVIGARAMGGGAPTGIDNTVIGRDSLFNATSATDNVGIGRDTLKAALSAKSNVAIGPAVLSNVIGGDFNIGLGHQALLALTEANDAIGIGFGVLPNLTTGNFNIAMGCDAGAGIIAGSNNILLGEGTGFSSDVSFMLNIGNSMYLSMQSSNFLGLGIEQPQHAIHIQRAGETMITVEAFSAASSTPGLRLRRSGSGTKGVFAPVDLNDVLGVVEFYGSDDIGWFRGAFMQATAEETFSINGAGTTLRFFTTPLGTIGATERFSIGDLVLYKGFEVATLDDIAAGPVNGPGATADFRVPTFDGLTGNLLRESTVSIDAAGAMSGVARLSMVGLPPVGDVGGFPAGQIMIQTTTSVLNTDLAGISGHSALAGNTQLWYLGSDASSSQAIVFENRSTFGNISLRGANGGLTVSGINGSVTHDAFTILGAGNVNIKVKTVVGTSPATEGATITIPHGLTLGKIMGWTCQVTADNGNLIPPNFQGVSEFRYQAFLTSTSISITLDGTSSANLRSNLVRVLLTYSP